jgi:hypothetical protein
MTDDNKGKEAGLLTRAWEQFKAAELKVAEWEGGKEAADLYKKSNDAYADGHYKDGFNLALQGHKKALGHVADAVTNAAQDVKHFVTGGEPVANHEAAPPTPAAVKPKTTTR